MKSLYEVTTYKPRRIKTVDSGWITATDGYIVHHCYQTASSEGEAIEFARMYQNPSARKFPIRAELV